MLETATAPNPQPTRVQAAPAARPEKPARLLSLDTFRGITIAGMLLVNNPGSWSHIYDPLEHAAWHGWTPTDLIFPFFLFIVGVSMMYSYGSALERGATQSELLLKSVKRAALIFLVGLLLHGFPNYIANLPTLRIPGVLQRIAFCYLVAAPIVLFTGVRGTIKAIAILLLGYWIAQTMIPVPGTGAMGVLEKGRDLGAFIDRAVFTSNHLWANAKTWDPEGLLSSFPAVGTVLLGALAGRWLRAPRSDSDKLVGLFIAGNVGLILGIIWHQVFPINKPLWTSSYVIFTGGMACHFLAMCYYLVDVRKYRGWAMPFVVFGTNAITAFFFSGIMARLMNMIKVNDGGSEIALKTFIYRNGFESWLSPINASLAFAICFVLLWLGIMTVLYRRRIFIKL